MEGSNHPLVLTRGLSLVILIGLIGMAASLFTQMYVAVYPVYHVFVFDDDLVLNDDFSTFEFMFPSADKIVIEELTTNESPVIINLYSTYDSENPSAIIQNVTEIRDVFLVGTRSEDSIDPIFRVTRYGNQSVQMSIKLKCWGTYPSTDYLVMGPSILLVLALPLYYSVYKNRGKRPNLRGYAIIFLIIISAVLLTPLVVYTYNHGDVPIRHDEVQDVRNYQFKLNASTPILEFTESLELEDSDSFVRIANLSTNSVIVGITVIHEGDTEGVELHTVTELPSNPLQFELPRENLTGFTVQFNRIAEDATIDLTVETVRDVWAPWIEPTPYYLAATLGLALFVAILIFPQTTETQKSDDSIQ